MNRADTVKAALIWDQVAAAAKDKAAGFRAELDADAKAEYAEQGTAPTWRLPDIGSVTLPVSIETPYVADMAALLKWAAERYPAEVEQVTQLRNEFVVGLISRVVVSAGLVIDQTTGEVVPGFGVREGGQARSLSIRPTPQAKVLIREAADGVVARFEAAFNGGESA